MKDLTSFQHECESKLWILLKKKNLNLVNRKLGGQKETYIYGQVKDLEIWIYEDSAEIGGNDIDKRFEKPDFKSEDDLINAFKNELESLIG